MEKTEKEPHKFGLVGKNISYSFSRGYFAKKFEDLGLDDYSYVNFDLENISELNDLIAQTENLKGLNVTIPYKEEIIPFLENLDDAAAEIGAVNTVKFNKGFMTGYNTDAYGFQRSLEPYLKAHHKKALILGTGGASKAIAYVLKNLGISFKFVSRSKREDGYTYPELTKDIIEDRLLIINCTPLGTYPDVNNKPNIPYDHINKKHLLFDLIYNPETSAFLQNGQARGATILNGLKMLEFQAEKAWEIWNR
ncbi:shikimate dehydrogenase [Maribacter sp. MMG018]|uniref:shikimate dehydrogenase family protein n=1 Tax=Maribacter sp. MMG018 TaxID=2822688 RepID=UPI001B386351|nr:shikimate dehydrogenase [Maribacter sp. MMG018]MBQ4915752.1 shikimate dehydrogenase [Maribacter sp. MMG018]